MFLAKVIIDHWFCRPGYSMKGNICPWSSRESDNGGGVVEVISLLMVFSCKYLRLEKGHGTRILYAEAGKKSQIHDIRPDVAR